ncbi:hypothetical protein OVN20_05110 [Microcella daejeonensis]|uniref:TadE family type IV pilus minor pilin n=1 Tax=Microcella daejeonensis TaxID=2994971 RepID=UPI00226F10D5|nr:TadE family type IV pilus minor pilin [Microcella daejeonensis]WAB84934.1 hypothetical protein OVN20_05110 [Microcella daejeonensis]
MRAGARVRDRGSVTAEIAVAVPALVLVLAVCLGGVSAALMRAQAQDAAAVAARMLARGEPESTARAHVGRVLPGASLAPEPADDLRCARVTAHPRVLGIELAVAARACALGGG